MNDLKQKTKKQKNKNDGNGIRDQRNTFLLPALGQKIQNKISRERERDEGGKDEDGVGVEGDRDKQTDRQTDRQTEIDGLIRIYYIRIKV